MRSWWGTASNCSSPPSLWKGQEELLPMLCPDQGDPGHRKAWEPFPVALFFLVLRRYATEKGTDIHYPGRNSSRSNFYLVGVRLFSSPNCLFHSERQCMLLFSTRRVMIFLVETVKGKEQGKRKASRDPHKEHSSWVQ